MSDDVKKVVQEHFAKTAHNYAAAPIHMQGEDLQWLVKALRLNGDERVLDAGTGAGPVAFAFAPHVKSVEGVDITPQMLEIAASHNDDDLLPFAEDEIPLIIELYVKAWYAPHPVETDERRAAVWAWWKLRWRFVLARLWRKRLKERPEMPGEGQPVVATMASPPQTPL